MAEFIHRDYVNMRTGELGTFEDHVAWWEQRAHQRGRVGSISAEVRKAGPGGDAGSSPAASTAPERGGAADPGETAASLGGVTSAPVSDAWRIIDTLLPLLEAKLARVTGHPIEWRFDHVRSALQAIRTVAVGRGGSGVVGDECGHARGCPKPECSTPVPGRYEVGESTVPQVGVELGLRKGYTIRPLIYDCGACDGGRIGDTCLTCGRGA